MKKLLIALFFVLSAASARSQFFINGFIGMVSTCNEGGYEMGLTWMNNSPSTIHGLRMAWYLGDHFRLGYTLHYGNNVVNSLVNRQRYRMYLIETGFYLEYYHKPIMNNWVLSFPVHFNGGSLYVPETYVPADQPNATGYLSLEPRVQLNRPLFKWLMFTASGGYRFMSAGSLYGTNSPNLAGPTFNLSLIFGNFE